MRRRNVLAVFLAGALLVVVTPRTRADSLFTGYAPGQPVSVSGFGFGETINSGNSSTVLLTQTGINTTYSGTWAEPFSSNVFTDSMTVNWSGFTPEGFLLTTHGEDSVVSGPGADSISATVGGNFTLTGSALVHIVASYSETNDFDPLTNGFTLESGSNVYLNVSNVTSGYDLDEVIDLPAGGYSFDAGAGTRQVGAGGTLDLTFGITAVTTAPLPSSACAATVLVCSIWAFGVWPKLRRRFRIRVAGKMVG